MIESPTLRAFKPNAVMIRRFCGYTPYIVGCDQEEHMLEPGTPIEIIETVDGRKKWSDAPCKHYKVRIPGDAGFWTLWLRPVSGAPAILDTQVADISIAWPLGVVENFFGTAQGAEDKILETSDGASGLTKREETPQGPVFSEWKLTPDGNAWVFLGAIVHPSKPTKCWVNFTVKDIRDDGEHVGDFAHSITAMLRDESEQAAKEALESWLMLIKPPHPERYVFTGFRKV